MSTETTKRKRWDETVVGYFLRYQLPDALYRGWLLLRYRPLMKCPFCKGKGGAVSGYYEPEWTECFQCNSFWDDLRDHGVDWAEGRMSLFGWVQSRLSIRFRFWERTRIRDIVRCRLRIHRWIDQSDMEPGLKICCVCYESKNEKPMAESEHEY